LAERTLFGTKKLPARACIFRTPRGLTERSQPNTHPAGRDAGLYSSARFAGFSILRLELLHFGGGTSIQAAHN